MAKLTFDDYLIAYAAVLSLLEATFLLVQRCNWGRKFSGASQCMIIAGVTVIFLIILYVILRRRPQGQVGYQLPPVFKMHDHFCHCYNVVCPDQSGFRRAYTIEKLWVCASVCICAYCLIELTRAANPSGMTLFMFLLSSGIYKTEGHQYWRIVFGVLLVAMLPPVTSGKANLRREAEALNPKPASEEEITYISVGSSGTISA